MNTFNIQSHRTQLLATAVVASISTAAALTAYNSYERGKRRRQLEKDVRRTLASAKSNVDIERARNEVDSSIMAPLPVQEFNDELTREQLARNYAFFGEEAMSKVRNGSVAIIGCGGVGSWAAVMLVRSGVSKIRLVDFDYVTLSSLNRHATATQADVGTPKVKCIARALRQISRSVDIDCRVEIWRKEDGAPLLEGMDWVIDAIDNIQTKVDLLKHCHSNGIKVFASMGAGAKCDPTRIQISDISYTMYDPLARSVRRRLREQGVSSGIPVVYSTEVPGEVKLLPLPEEEFSKGDVKELGAFDDFRVRILPVIGPLPSVFGLHIAAYIICELAGKPILNPMAVKYRKKLYERMYKDLLAREQRLLGQVINRLPIDEDNVGLIFDDLHRGRSILPPHDVPAKPTLVRWDPTQPISLENVTVMDSKDAEKHYKACFGLGVPQDLTTTSLISPEDLWGQEVVNILRKRRDEIRRYKDWVM